MGDDLLEELDGSVLAPIIAQGGVAEAEVIIDADMQALPADTAHVVAAIAGHAVAGPADAAELFGVEVEQFAGSSRS